MYGAALQTKSDVQFLQILNSRSVLDTLEAIKYKVFYCVYQGREVWTLEELREVVNPLSRAYTVLIKYRSITGNYHSGSLITLLLDAIRQRDELEKRSSK